MKQVNKWAAEGLIEKKKPPKEGWGKAFAEWPAGESWVPKDRLRRQIAWDYMVAKDAAQLWAPPTSERRAKKAPKSVLPSDDPRYGIGLNGPAGEIATGPSAKNGGQWFTNGHYLIRAPEKPPPGLVKRTGTIELAKTEAKDRKFPQIDNVMPTDAEAATMPRLEEVAWKAPGERGFGGGIVAMLEKESGAVVGINNHYIRFVEETWPGGEWRSMPKRKEDTRDTTASDRPVAYTVDGNLRAVVMPMHMDKITLPEIRAQAERHVEYQALGNAPASSTDPIPPTPGSLGAAAAAAYRQKPLIKGLKKQAQDYGYQMPSPGEPAALTPAQIKNVEAHLKMARKLFGMKAAKPIADYLKASKKLSTGEARRQSALERQRKATATLDDLAATGVPIPADGRALSDAERAILAGEGKDYDADITALLGRSGAIKTVEDFKKLPRSYRLVHVARRIRAATHDKVIDNILSAEKYRIWDEKVWSKDDLAALVEVVGERFRGMKFTGKGMNAELRAALAGLDFGTRRGIATGDAPTADKITKWVYKLAPSRNALRNLGMLQDATFGIRGAVEGWRREWNMMAHEAEHNIFRDDRKKLIHKGSRDSAIIFELWNNTEGDPKYLERKTITMQTKGGGLRRGKWAEGEKIEPQEHHRRAARRLVELFEELADRQGLLEELRKTYYAPHTGPREILHRVMDLSTATPGDRSTLHKLAEKHVKDYDRAEVEKLLPDDMSRARVLQVVDMIRGTRPRSLKNFRHKLSTIMASNEKLSLPDEHWKPYQPHLKERRGGPYFEDAVLAYETYARYALRKIWLEPTVNRIRPQIEHLGESKKGIVKWTQRAYAEEWINQVLGRPKALEQAWQLRQEQLAMKLGEAANLPVIRRLFRPAPAARLSMMVNRYQYYRLLGFALDSALTNFTQGVNSWAMFGFTPTVGGYARLFGNPKNLWWLVKGTVPGVQRVRNLAMREAQDPGVLKFKGKAHGYQPLPEFAEMFTGVNPLRAITQAPLMLVERLALSPFTAIEYVNRGAAYLSALSEAKSKGLSFEKAVKLGEARESEFIKKYFPEHFRDTFYVSEAEWHARARVLETQFGYSKAESSPVLGTPLGRVGLQFFSYPTQQAAMFADGMKGKFGESRMRQLRFMALFGMMVAGGNEALERMFGVDVSNLWSIRGIVPRGPGPNILALWWLWSGVMGDEANMQKLTREYGTPASSELDVPLSGLWVPRGIRKATGITHKTLGDPGFGGEPGIDPFRLLPARPVEDEGRKTRRPRRKRKGREGR
jgi:hypothetical protein